MHDKRINLILYMSFLLSGVAGLIYEVLWARYLSLIFGNTAYAHSLVLATFMGGLALGSYLLGRSADKIKDKLSFYAWIQIGIAVFCIFTPYLFAASKSIYIGAAKNLSLGPAGITIIKFLIGAAIMLPPTILMGGTLPILSKFMIQSLFKRGKTVARLYCINSLGAVLGTLLAGFYLIYHFGLRHAITVAAVINVLAGGIIFLLRYFHKKTLQRLPAKEESPSEEGQEESLPEEEVKPYEAEIYSPQIIKVSLVAIFLSGFAAMLYEVVWIRLLSIVLGSSTYSFSLMLAAFISGITIGSFLISKFMPREKKTYFFFGLCEIFIALTLILTLPFYGRLPFLFIQLSDIFSRKPETFIFYSAIKFFLCFLVMLPPTIFLGMTLPLVSKITSNKLKVLGRKIGGVFAINTAGNILGALAAGLLLISILGLKYTLEVGIVINLLVGVVIVFTDKTVSFKKTFVLASACYLVFFGYKMMVPDWNKAWFTQQIFRKMDGRETYEDYSERMNIARDRIVFYKDGVDATVSVFKWPGSLSLYVNGKADASTSGGDLSTQIMLAQLPMTLKPRAEDLLVVGLGSGITCGSALLHPIENLDVVEICQSVVDANTYFASFNNYALKDERLHLYVEDAKTFLQKSKKKYDVIISEPSNPWISGIGSLFSIEFFEDCARHLKDGGLMIQWVQGYEIDNETFELVLRTFHSIFPEIQVWIAGTTDVLLVGSETKIEPDLNESEKRMAQKQIKDDLSKIGINDLFTLLNMQTTSAESLRSSLKMNGRVHSDYYPILDYRAPMVLYTDSYLRLSKVAVDERRDTLAEGNLLLDTYLKDHKIDRNNLQNLYRHISKYKINNKELIIPLAVKWYREYPEDENATLAYASHNIDSLENSIRLLEKLIVEDKKLEYLDSYATTVVKKYKILRASFFPEALSDAIEKLEMCISLSKDKKPTFYYFAGKIHIDRKDYETALVYYLKGEQSMEFKESTKQGKKNYLNLLDNISFAYLKTDNPDKALEYAEKILALDKNNPRAKLIIAVAKTKKKSKAKE